jgi:hypothetical protein
LLHRRHRYHNDRHGGLYNSLVRENDQDGQEEKQQRSIGDVVQGLHGSKYQFSTASSTSYEGQQFAQSGYTSGNYGGDKSSVLTTLQKQPLPDWTIEWQKQFVSSSLPLQQRYIEIDQLPTTITIQNDERTWEPFYTFVLLIEQADNNTIMRKIALDASYLIHVTPRIGILAPRGKSSSTSTSDVDSFSDTIQLHVEQKQQQVLSSSMSPSSSSLWMLVGTEAEKWIYEINITI